MDILLSEECNRVGDFIDKLINCDILDDIFSGFVIHYNENEISYKKEVQENFLAILKELPKESMDEVIKYYVYRTSVTINYQHCTQLFSLLEVAIHKEITTAKYACMCICWLENFDFQNEVFWVTSLNFIHRIIKFVDYKGVRDIMTVLLAKITLIPSKSSLSSKQINSLYVLIEYIFDRDAALLPAYFVLDEIQKKCAWQNGHWKFSKLISSFVDSFRSVAKIVSNSGRPKILPLVGHSFSPSSFKLDHVTGKFKLRGLLPYDKELNEPQISLLQFIIEQNNSCEMIVSMLSLNITKGRNIIVENLLVELFIKAITKSGNLKFHENESFENLDLENGDNEIIQIMSFWQHVSSTSLFLEFMYQSILLPNFLEDLYKSIVKYKNQHSVSKLLKSREFLMWALMMIISNHVQKSAMENPVICQLFDLLYPEKEPIPLPDMSKLNSIYILSAATTWILMMKKAEVSQIKFYPIPISLKLHVEFLQETAITVVNNSNQTDFSIVPICNSFFLTPSNDAKVKPFIENILNKGSSSGTNGIGSNGQYPVPMNILDSLTIQTKIILLNHIMSEFTHLAQTKSLPTLPSGLVETYSRLMTYNEIENFGIKTFSGQLLLNFVRNHCWSYLYSSLELFAYRMHHVNCAYRIQILRQLHTKSAITQIHHIQLYTCIENTTLKILLGLNSTEFLNLPNLIQHRGNESALSFLPSDSEELIKIFVLTLARAFHVTGSETLSAAWVNEMLTGVKVFLNTNLSWPEFTLKCFPSVIAKFYQEMAKPKEPTKEQLKQSVEEDFRKWKSMSNEGAIIKHFTSKGPPSLFYCLLYKLLLDNEPISLVAYKILDRIPARNQSLLLRTFADYLVYEVANVGGNRLNKFLEVLSDFIWKYGIVSFDRLLLCLALRNFEGNDAQVCFFIIISILVKNTEFQKRVSEFVKENSPEHWKQSNWAEKQSQFQKKFPEKYYFDHIQDNSQGASTSTSLPVMFSNVCLRVLPVIDVIIHRIIELPNNAQTAITIDPIIEQHGCLYKFHSQPITFLYNTLHYYEANLRKKTNVKRKLVYGIINAFKDIRPRNWAVTETFLNYCQKNNDEEWNVGPDYYRHLIGRLVDAMSGQSKNAFYTTDYRFNEFPNVTSHALFVTSVEILALPGEPADIAGSIVNIVTKHHRSLPRQDIELWINAIAMIFTSLPDSYSNVINERIITFLENPQALADKDLFYLVDFNTSRMFMNESEISYLVGLSHAFWNHGSIGQICSLEQFLKERIKPIIQNEEQFLFVCYLVGPFLDRFSIERTRCVMDIVTELYGMLEIIDKKCPKLKHVDKICDLLYHIKYQFTGDLIKKKLENPIKNMKPELSNKLRFISNIVTTTDST